MISFDLKCPKNYPLKCNLPDVEKEALVRSELFKGFLMYQFHGQKQYTISSLKRYFGPPTYFLLDAQNESGLGVKICKICRLALASDFGIASLTPLNSNVFFEVGFMQGLGKPVIYVVDADYVENGVKGGKAIPFDLSDQMVIEHLREEDLHMKLEREVPRFIEKVQLSSTFEKVFVNFVKLKLFSLDEDQRTVLKFLVLEQSQSIFENYLRDALGTVDMKIGGSIGTCLHGLERMGFIRRWVDKFPGRTSSDMCALEEQYRGILRDIIFKEAQNQ